MIAPISRAHPPAPDHSARDLGELLEVRLRTRRQVAEDDLLGRAAAECDLDLRAQLLLRIVEAVRVGRRERDAEREPARDDRDLPHRVGAFGEHPDDRVAAFVIRGPPLVRGGHHHLPLGAENDLLERVREVRFLDLLVTPARGEQRSLVDEVREVGADHSRRRRRDPAEIDVRRERHAAGVHLENRLAAVAVRRLHRDAPVEPPRPQQRLVEHVRAVGRPDHDHADGRVEAVHLREDLVQRLLALVVPAAETGDAGGARPTDRVELVDEDDRRLRLLRLREEIAHARRSDPDDRLDELRRRHREERHVGLARNRARQQRLTRSGRAAQ